MGHHVLEILSLSVFLLHGEQFGIALLEDQVSFIQIQITFDVNFLLQLTRDYHQVFFQFV